MQETRALARLQATVPTAAELAHLPRLTLADLERRPALHVVREAELLGRPLLVSELDSSGVVYFDLGFDCRGLHFEDLLYLDLFGVIVTELGTGSKDYRQFATERNLYTGGFDHSFQAYVQAGYYTRFNSGNSTNLVLLDASIRWTVSKRTDFSLTGMNLLNRKA